MVSRPPPGGHEMKYVFKRLFLKFKPDIVAEIERVVDRWYDIDRADAEMIYYAIYTRLFGSK